MTVNGDQRTYNIQVYIKAGKSVCTLSICVHVQPRLEQKKSSALKYNRLLVMCKGNKMKQRIKRESFHRTKEAISCAYVSNTDRHNSITDSIIAHTRIQNPIVTISFSSKLSRYKTRRSVICCKGLQIETKNFLAERLSGRKMLENCGDKIY